MPTTRLTARNSLPFYRKALILLFLAALLGASCLTPASAEVSAKQPDLAQPIPFDPDVTRGQLGNGLVYYLRTNHKPEHRAELRLLVKAGSILENDDQQGLAHFIEHMAFNGTKHFKKQELVQYLESIGMRFGADVNAYTSFDETVYSLQIPTDKPEIISKAFQILEDWAHEVTFDPEEVDKERPVIVEEWRSGRGAEARMRDQQWPILLKNSKYAVRMPIGKKEFIESFPRDALLRFYKHWYRPDLMAIVAVGDFDVPTIRKLIDEHFRKLQNPKHERLRETYLVPPHAETLFAIASDPENPRSTVQVVYKSALRKEETLADVRQEIVENLFYQMVNERFLERSREADPSFVFGFADRQRFVGPVEAIMLTVAVKENGIERGLSALLEEARRVELYGFTSNELEIAKTRVLRLLDQWYADRDKTESENYVPDCVNHFLNQEPMPGIEWQHSFIPGRLAGISLQEVNDVAKTGLTGGSRVIMVNLPQKESVNPVTESALTGLLEQARTRDVKPYEEQLTQEPLLKSPPAAGTLVSETKIPEVGLTEWRLNNGVRVLLKPTDFKNDEIVFSAWSPGGSSLVADSDAVSAMNADDLVQESGLGNLDQIQLEKLLAGKIADVSPFISTFEEGLRGRASPKDLETALQLVYLSFTAPRFDEKAVASFLAKQKALLQNRSLQPEARFQDEVKKIMSQNHFRARPPSLELLKELNPERAYHIYQDRFADAGDFTFAFVGSFQLETIKPLILTYLGSLPGLNRKETWKDLHMLPPDGVVEKQFHIGKEPKGRVLLFFDGPFQWTHENRIDLLATCQLLNNKLLESLREELGGVYGVGVSPYMDHIPEDRYTILIRFGCAPERVDELVKTVMAEIESLKKEGPKPSDVDKVREAMRRERETSLKQNDFWLSVIENSYWQQDDVREVLETDQIIQHLNPQIIQKTVQTYFDDHRYVKAVLLPEIPAAPAQP